MLGAFSVAFLGLLAGSWTGSRAARTQAGTLVCDTSGNLVRIIALLLYLRGREGVGR